MLDVPAVQLRDDFSKYPWVRDVEQVFYAQRTINVHLRYRQPVAYVPFPRAERILLDETGTILSIKDVNVGQLSHLIKISGKGLALPSDSKAGVVWKSRPEGSDHDEPDRRILAATKLAGFLTQPTQLGDAERWPALQMININVAEYHPFTLFLWSFWRLRSGGETHLARNRQGGQAPS